MNRCSIRRRPAVLGETDAASGLVRVYGQWTLLGRGTNNPGQLVFKGENRHRMTAITPFDLGFEAGSILPTGTFFSEFNYGVTNLFWKQYLCDRDLVFAIGKIDVTDFVDVYGSDESADAFHQPRVFNQPDDRGTEPRSWD